MSRQRVLYSPTGHTAYHHVGAEASTSNGAGAWSLVGWAAVGASAYHGYKRNHSVGWAIGWAIAGAFAPIITVPVAIAQGFGKRKGG